jgi:hypothetical protein
MARGGEDLMWGDLKVQVEQGGPWEVVDGPQEVVGSRPPTWQLIIVPMQVGELQLPGLETTVRPPDGEPTTVTLADPPQLTVASVLPPGEEVAEPAPLRDPVGVGGFPWEWVLPAGLVLLPLAGVLAWWLRRRRRESAADARPKLPPFAELETGLKDLAERVGREPSELVCDRLASALRRYLERRCGEPAGEMTSFELRLMARRLAWPGAMQRGLQRAMDVADGVRFGRRPSSEAELHGAIDEALTVGRTLEEHLSPKPELEENTVLGASR